MLCKFWVAWTLEISSRNDEISYQLQWTHWKPLQFKQVLGSTQCCSNYTKKIQFDLVNGLSVWPVQRLGQHDLETNKFKGNSCKKWQMAWVTDGCVSVYVFVIIDSTFSGFLFFFFLSFFVFYSEPQRWSVAAGTLSWYVKWDLYQAYSRHKVLLCLCQVSDSVCNVKVAVSDLDNVQEIKAN